MATIHLQRIKSALEIFRPHIDLSDYASKPPQERESAFLSRALAAYALVVLSEASPEVASKSITDGYNDGGLDAIHFDAENSVLFFVQSKWIHDGDGAIAQGECKKFLDGFRDIISSRYQNFSDKIRNREPEIRKALLNAQVRLTIVLAHTGTQPVSTHVKADVDRLLGEMNHPVEVMSAETFDQTRLYSNIAAGGPGRRIKLEIALREWGVVKEPYLAYYGQVDAISIAKWWSDYGKELFRRNIRNFKGDTNINNAIADTLSSGPKHLWY